MRSLTLLVLAACRIGFDERFDDGGAPPIGEICTEHWCWDDAPAAELLSLRAISGSSATNVWAAGDAGVIRRWDGTAWRYVMSPTTDAIVAIHVVSESDVTIAAGAGVIWHYDGDRWLSSMTASGSSGAAFWRNPGAGDLWIASDIGKVSNRDGSLPDVPTRAAATALHGRDVNNVWHAGAFNTVSHWDGAAWAQQLISDFPVAVWALETSVEAYAGGQHIWRCDATMCTQIATSANVRALFGFADDNIWSVGLRGTIRHWTGTAWDPVAAPNGLNYRALWGAAPDDIWAVGDFGAIMHYDGATWTSIGNDVVLHSGWNALFVAADDDMWLTTNGEMWRRTSAGLAPVPLPPGAVVGDEIRGSAADRVCAINDAGQLICFDGTAWTGDIQMGLQRPAGLLVTPTEKLASDTMGNIYAETTPNTWALAFATTNTEYHGICASPSNDILVVGRFGRAATRTSGTWATNNSPTGRYLVACDFAGETAWAIGGDAVVTYSAGAWTLVPGTATTHALHDVLAVTPNEVYVPALHGRLMAFDGAVWREEAVPTAFALNRIGQSPSGTIYIVTAGGQILRRR